MRAAQERGQECLPPKKRDLPTASAPVAEQPSRPSEKAPGPPASSGSSFSCSAEWVQAPSPFVPEAVAGLTLDQYGLLYKVAVPPPPPAAGVVSVGALPPAFGVASQLIQHPGLPYSPLHFAQLPPAPLHFVGSPYSLPFALPPGFVPGHLLPSSAAIPHFVPYAPLLAEDSGSTAQAAHAFGKESAQQPLDVSQGRIPVYYQVSRLPTRYPAFDAPIAALDPESALLENHLNPKTATENGLQRTAAGAKEGEAEERWPRAAVQSGSNGPILLRAEASSGASQRSSPDTDLEVQRVVGVLSFQDCLSGSSREKDGLSPLNLSHRGHSPEPKGQPARNPGEAEAAERPPEQLLKGPVVANGKPVLGSLQPAAQDSLDASRLEAVAQEATGASRPQSHLPSHFMKGAIIQLATGELKRVEDLQTQDFVRSAEVSGGLKIDSSTVVDIQESPWQGLVTLHFVVGEQQSKVSIDVPPEHPFFVYGQGWSSCSPERTTRLFSLPCHVLQVGDVCISISLQSLNGHLAPLASPPADSRERSGRSRQGIQEPLAPVREKSSPGKGGVALGSPPDASWLSPISAHGWAGPSFQRLEDESPGPPLLRPSFIPQEVKLSIEGRSNAGK
ncbi:ataxin-1-like [Sceloporus undulatus]|uniref:ataxin-1-like n=1 Tax=Sceloporus undulatus TaxID=8520 RepID=UPI001C4C8A61|nr:ataxin-1-like [Sceloporus undulatus]